ncbi:MAG: AMP-binding protein, partial [Clostridia bacterium]|nr:AMP-binding protein [Clostridia bacterium]
GVQLYVPMAGEDSVDETLPHAPRVMGWDNLLALGANAIEAGDDSYYANPVDLEKMCAILFTSGTTGTSKGVMLSQGNLCAAAYASSMTTPYDSRTRLVSVLPQHHTYEMTCSHIAAINLGCSEFINDSLKYVMRNFANYQPNALVLVPLFVETIHKRIRDEIRKKGMEKKVAFGKKLALTLLPLGIDIRPKLFSQITSALGGKVESIICGGAPVSPEILRDFYAYGITIYEGYGITECAPLLACNVPGEKPRFGSVGKPVYGVTLKIDKADPADETGEILAKGPNVMLGYYKNEEATREVFTEDGWFRTGDIGYIDRDGYVYITGRKKNVIILSNGKNVFPEELEEHLSHSDLIKESVVIGRPDESGEIAITALIYPDPDLTEGKSPEEIESAIRAEVDNINRSLPSFKHMSVVEVRDTEFEKTTSKKIKRFLYK